ncbi:MAG: asparaginase [bacterium]|nr:asparaginase [bacterium]
MTLPTICIVASGGTICSTYDKNLGGWVPAASAEEMTGAIPELSEIANLRLIEHSRVAGTRMSTATAFGLRDCLRDALRDDAVTGAVITHGTATIEETAYLLDLTLGLEKPVAITGAQRNFDEPDSDGPRNILHAVQVVADPAAGKRGVLVVCGGEIHAARNAMKTHTHHLTAFSSRDSGPVGAVTNRGYGPTKTGVVFFAHSDRRLRFDVNHVVDNVQLIKMVQGMDDLLVRACLGEQVNGIVVEGWAGAAANHTNFLALCDALQAGIPVILATRVFGGCPHTEKAYPGSYKSLIDRDAISAGYLSGPKARILLMVALAHTQDRDELQIIFENA